MLKPESVWRAVRCPRFGKLKKSARYDAIVIGGGITGMTAAYLLKQGGKSVCLLERDRIGAAETASTTAHLTYVTDLRVSDMVSTFGEDAASLIWEAGSVAIDRIEAIARAEQIDCEFRRVPGYLHASLTGTQDEAETLRSEAALAQRIGFPAKFVAAVPYFRKPGIRFPDQAKFHPLKYLAGLAKAVNGDGSVIHEESEVSEVLESPQRVKVGDYEIETDYIVIATHVPLMGKTGLISAALFQTKIFPYSTYALGAKVARNLVPEASFWDTSDPYYYLRVEPGKTKDYVIFGGEDHKTGQVQDTEACFANLTARLQEILPGAQPDRRWSGQVIETNDGLPYIGETAENQFVATGFSGNGMTFGTLSGMMACDAALGKANLWQELFSVHRKKLRGGTWDYITENADFPYYYLKDRIAGAEGASTRQVKRGEGKVLDIAGERVACSRDAEGKLTTVSAVCTHMGCLVRWNNAEQTWDCPCHGSRFKPDGEVLSGPAETPLEPVKPPKKKRAAPANP